MKSNIIVTLFVLLISVYIPSSAQGKHVGVGVVLSVPTNFMLQNDDPHIGTNVNIIYGMVNASLEQSSIIAGHDTRIKKYIGAGLGPFLQLQYGFHSVIRVRSEIVLFSGTFPTFGYFEDKWGMFREGIVISPIIDFSATGSRTADACLSFGVYF